jgi:hypothetical protein
MRRDPGAGGWRGASVREGAVVRRTDAAPVAARICDPSAEPLASFDGLYDSDVIELVTET